jgi:Holliday junction resolvase RusA-like endonuclease
MNFYVRDMMGVEGPSDRSISFVIVGDPPAQQRHKLAWKNLSVSRAWDPSAKPKETYVKIVRTAMKEIGINTFPYFTQEKPIALTVRFVLPRPRSDLRTSNGVSTLIAYPSPLPFKKDIDNMLKFLMDALDGGDAPLMYANDVIITDVVMGKAFPEDVLSRGWTEVHFSTSSTSTVEALHV